ncbi:MAG TPA: hypothetical protein VFU56_03975 [Gaiellaceae bacterium]|nr:hypothetical protein [Gaiellaceae bacterium]
MVDRRLLTHWQREQGARKRARASLPPSWRRDPREAMADVRESYVEGLVAMRRVRD